MSLTLKASKAAFFVALFFAAVIVVSAIVGYVTLNSMLIVPVSLALAYLIYRKFGFPKEFHVNNKLVFLLAIFFAAMLSYEVTFAHRNYLASHEPIHTTVLRIIEVNQKIPTTYEPFSQLAINYQFGFQLVAKIFAEIFPQVPDYYSLWFLGLVVAMLEIIFVFIFVKIFFKSENISLMAAALVPTSKIIMLSFLAGGYDRLMAESYVFMFLALYLIKHNAKYIMPLVLLVVHPGYFLGAVIFTGIHSFINKDIKQFLKAHAFVVLALPVVAIQLYPFFKRGLLNIWENIALLVGGKELTLATKASYFPTMWIALPGTYGVVPIVLFGIMLAYTVLKRDIFRLEQNTKVLLAAASFQLVFGYLLMFYYSIAGEKFVNNFVLLGLIFGVVQLHKYHLAKLTKKKFYLVVIIMLAIGLVAVYSSKTVQHYLDGRSIDKRNAEFGLEFYKYDNSLAKTFFATNYNGKLAELANKVPTNPYENTFVLTRDDFIASEDQSMEIKKTIELHRTIIDNKCARCIDELGVKYIVIDYEFASIDPQNNWKLIFEKNGIRLFERQI